MANQLVTTACLHCRATKLVISPDSPFAKVDIYGSNGSFSVPIMCTACGWRGVEVWKVYYSTTNTTFVPPKKAVTPTVQMFEVESSVIKAIGYDRAWSTLYVQFHSSDEYYGYKNVEMERFIDLLNADSKGRYYSRYIRGVYERV